MPMSGDLAVSRASGLIDGDGYFRRDLDGVRRNIVREAAEAELRAQIEGAFSSGLQPKHINAHMAAAMLAELPDAHVRLGYEYGLFTVLPRSISWAPDLLPGLTHLAQHWAAPGHFSAISPLHAPWRYAEHELFARAGGSNLCGIEEIAVTGTRALQKLFVSQRTGSREGRPA